MGKRRAWALFSGGAVLACLLIVSCGGETDTTHESPATATSPATESAGPETPAVMEDLAKRLQKAGLPAQATYLSGGKSSMSVGGVKVTYFADPLEAEREASGLLALAKRAPDNVLAVARGQIVVWASTETGVTGAEAATFAKVEKALEANP